MKFNSSGCFSNDLEMRSYKATTSSRGRIAAMIVVVVYNGGVGGGG